MNTYAADGPLEPPGMNDEDCLCEDECGDLCTDDTCYCSYHISDEWEYDRQD